MSHWKSVVWWILTHTSSTGSTFIGVHTNSHKFESCTRDSVDPNGSPKPNIVTVSPSGSLVVNITLFSSDTVHWCVSDPFTVMEGTLFAAATNNTTMKRLLVGQLNRNFKFAATHKSHRNLAVAFLVGTAMNHRPPTMLTVMMITRVLALMIVPLPR